MDFVDLCKDSIKDAITPPKVATDTVVPLMTPEVVTKNGDFQSQSPFTLSVVRKQLNLACIHCDSESLGIHNDGNSIVNGNENQSSRRTPKDGVFDPFAPGPNDIARAPDSNKYLDKYRTVIARRLDFHLFDVAQANNLSDEDMVEYMYKTLLEEVVSNQAEGVLAQMSSSCESPPFALLFTGIANTCPDTTVKRAAKPRNIDLGLCKKLEF